MIFPVHLATGWQRPPDCLNKLEIGACEARSVRQGQATVTE
jgi:hypothetical protein